MTRTLVAHSEWPVVRRSPQSRVDAARRQFIVGFRQFVRLDRLPFLTGFVASCSLGLQAFMFHGRGRLLSGGGMSAWAKFLRFSPGFLPFS